MVLDHVSPTLRLTIPLILGATFRIAFLLIASYMAMGAILAWFVPVRRLS